MPRPFVQYYDVIYGDKDYDKDIETFAALAGVSTVAGKKVIEIGAGTGNHTFRLALKVGELVSVEIDTDFAEVLRSKLADGTQRNVSIFDCPIEALPEMGFDAAVAFFHVLNYIGQEHMESFLGGLAKRLKPGAHFIADVWNGAAAMLDPPREEVRRKTIGTTHVVQRIQPSIDIVRRTVTLNYEIDIGTEGQMNKLTERIQLYLWHREELERALHQAGFSDVTFWDYRLYPVHARAESWRLWLRAIRN
jgi:SAM-dependent methyltransferase